MNSRPPTIDPPRDREIVRLQRLLAELEAIPEHRRAEELADQRAETVRALIAELGNLTGMARIREERPDKEHQYYLHRSMAGEHGAVWLWLLPALALVLIMLSILA